MLTIILLSIVLTVFFVHVVVKQWAHQATVVPAQLNNAKLFQMRADVNFILVVMTVAQIAAILIAAVFNALTFFDI